MTRINANIRPELLTDEHLVAEHRELKRLPYYVKHYLQLDVTKRDSIPNKFTLGKGHVKFFYNKMEFAFNRYEKVYEECRKRGFNVAYYGYNWNFIKSDALFFYADWEFTKEDNKLVIDRITERIVNSNANCFHYYKKQIRKEEAVLLLTCSVTREEFDRYNIIRDTGVVNMLDSRIVCHLADITPEVHKYIVTNYTELYNIFGDENHNKTHK